MAVAVHAPTPRMVAGVRTTLIMVASSTIAAGAALKAQGFEPMDYRFEVLKRPDPPDR
jgi:hypothetical protein